ncbi:hypothetical protein VB005_02864 [Metarhizium brunneum]
MDKLTRGWVQHQRKAARQEAASRSVSCPLCEAEVQHSLDEFKAHYTLKHPTSADHSDIEEAFKNCTLQGNDATKARSSETRPPGDTTNAGAVTRKRPVSGNPDFTDRAEDDFDRLNLAGDDSVSTRRGSKKICSPPASITQQRGSSPPTPGRSRARLSERDDDFVRTKNPTGRQLWTADDARKTAIIGLPSIKASAIQDNIMASRNILSNVAGKNDPLAAEKTLRSLKYQYMTSFGGVMERRRIGEWKDRWQMLV